MREQITMISHAICIVLVSKEQLHEIITPAMDSMRSVGIQTDRNWIRRW